MYVAFALVSGGVWVDGDPGPLRFIGLCCELVVSRELVDLVDRGF